MNKIKHFETESGKIVKTAQIDGYNINEKPFEGLMFQIDVLEDGTLKSYVKPEDQEYFSDFNEVKWLAKVTEFAYNNDIFNDPISGDDCWIIFEDNTTDVETKTATPIVVGKSPFGKSDKTESMKSSIQDIANRLGLGDVTFGEDGIAIADKETETSVEEVKVPVIGEFKPKRKFLTFVSAIAGKKVRFLRDSATIKGEKLSGMLEGVTFKITICDEGTINFDEVDTNKTDKAMRQRLINDIDDIQTSGYANKFIVSGLEFTDVDGSRCYLEVEHKTPFDKLKSIFDTDEVEEVEEVEEVVLSEKGLSILDMLFADEDTSTEIEDTSTEIEEVPVALTYAEEQFRKMNEAKVVELKQRIEDSERDILKYKKESKMALKNVDELSDKLSVLQTRLETLSVGDEPNGWAFFVSDIQKIETGLDESTKAVADKIADLMKLKKDVLFEHLTASYYKISIAEKSNFDNKKLTTDLLEKINTLDIDGKISMTSDGEFEYRGKLNWHQLTAKMIRKGFEQVPDFDKVVGSNSYEVKTEKEIV